MLVAPPEAVEVVSEPVVDLKPSTPLALSYPEIGVDAVEISGYSDSEVQDRGGVNPYTSWDIAWWTGGGRPGDVRTTYLYGHTWNGSTAVFNDLPLAEEGDTFEVHTDDGTLTYVVTETFEVSKGFGFTSDPRVLEDSPGRIVLATCDGPPTNIVVIGQLVP